VVEKARPRVDATRCRRGVSLRAAPALAARILTQ